MSLAYPCLALPAGAEACYSRLCPGKWPPFSEHALHALAERMRDSPEKRMARAQPLESVTRMPSGYVYLGQFIDHDLTWDGRSLNEARPEVEQTPNYRTPKLDLDHLYGKDPASVPCIYRQDGERLRLGLTREAHGRTGHKLAQSRDDLPRKEGTAVVIDSRSDENLLAAQLHVLFAKFHNCVVELLKKQPALAPGPAGSSLLDQARRFVTWHYQWIVLHDFLPRIARRKVLLEVERDRFRLFPRRFWASESLMALPVEFTVAAFRFGHSMVRHDYILNDHVGFQTLDRLIRMTKRGRGIADRLPASHVIDWDRFFGGTPGRLNRARLIDTHLSEALYDLPRPAPPHGTFLAHEVRSGQLKPPLPELTLKRGSRIGLPSAQEFAREFRLPLTVPEEQIAPPEEMAFFRTSGFAERTPLWYYLLREASVEPNPEPGRGPYLPLQQLGSLGSLIVAEVFYQVLNADFESIRNAGRAWQPPAFQCGASVRVWSLRSMRDILEFVRAGPG